MDKRLATALFAALFCAAAAGQDVASWTYGEFTFRARQDRFTDQLIDALVLASDSTATVGAERIGVVFVLGCAAHTRDAGDVHVPIVRIKQTDPHGLPIGSQVVVLIRSGVLTPRTLFGTVADASLYELDRESAETVLDLFRSSADAERFAVRVDHGTRPPLELTFASRGAADATQALEAVCRFGPGSED